MLRIRGASAVHNYLIQEVLKVYRQQGVDINDKHIEVIVRQMMRKVRVEDADDAEGLLSGAMADVMEVRTPTQRSAPVSPPARSVRTARSCRRPPTPRC